MALSESPELVDLFTTYTASPDSIGAHLAAASARGTERDPLLVVTGTDIALYPGGGEAPVIQPYRLGNRGFRELAGISHLGPALASLARLREISGDAGEWRADASRLLAATRKARAANSARLWRDTFAIRAFAGREERVAAMVDYSCLLTERFLRRALDDPGYLTMAAVRGDFLAGPAGDLPVPFNKVMIATFYLTGMDIAHRLITWFDAAGIDWSRAMVVFAGQPGRPTSGVTEESHSVAGIVRAVSRGPARPRAAVRRPARAGLPPRSTRRAETPASRPRSRTGTAGCGPGCAPPVSSAGRCSTATPGSRRRRRSGR